MTIKCAAGPAFAIGWLFMHAAGAEPNKALYELQERCANQARESFQREWGANVVNTKDGRMTANYENHYSAKFNKCFYLEISTTYPSTKNGAVTKNLRLFDLHENKEYATYSAHDGLPPICEVRDLLCHSEGEWRSLVRQFMDE